ncbi:hypothetical protein EG329_009385 [Mollisiaceae sp. DMI_Dod_QoI]|nr:hypothetical protein EG329_009385 [Helotiales sp. DMI_Dod_QoI]
MAELESEVLWSFHKFGELPPELRQQIWKMAQESVPGRVAEIKYYITWCKGSGLIKSNPRIFSRGTAPALLSTTHESREAALKQYNNAAHPNLRRDQFMPSTFLFECDKDVLYIHDLWRIVATPTQKTEEVKKNVKFLAIPTTTTVGSIGRLNMKCFRSVEKVFLVWDEPVGTQLKDIPFYDRLVNFWKAKLIFEWGDHEPNYEEVINLESLFQVVEKGNLKRNVEVLTK